MVFQLLEKQAETHFQLEKLKFLQNYTCLDRQALEQFVQVRGTGSHYFCSSIILVRRNYTVGSKHVINWSAVHDIKGLTVQEKDRSFSSPFTYLFILIYCTSFFSQSWTPKICKSADAPLCYLAIISTSWFSDPSLIITWELCMGTKTKNQTYKK